MTGDNANLDIIMGKEDPNIESLVEVRTPQEEVGSTANTNPLSYTSEIPVVDQEREKGFQTFRKALFILDKVLLVLVVLGGIACIVLFAIAVDPAIGAVTAGALLFTSICFGVGIWGIKRNKLWAVLVLVGYCLIALLSVLVMILYYHGFYWGRIAGLVVCFAMFAVHAQYAILLWRRARGQEQPQDGYQQNSCTDMENEG